MQRRSLTFLLASVVLLPAALVIPASGQWREKVLYSFQGGPTDGSYPFAGITLSDQTGKFIYGTTVFGGKNNCGTFFQLTVAGPPPYTESPVYNFPGGSLGCQPWGGLYSDGINLYGTTALGGANGAGIIFELMPANGGGWVEYVLYNFTGGNDGGLPYSGLSVDNLGNLYGTTLDGGAYGAGVVYRLCAPGNCGSWMQTVLYSFCALPACADGSSPLGGVAVDGAQNVYGTTFYGGSPGCSGGCGLAFELSPNPTPPWTETVLHEFGGATYSGVSDGINPWAGVTLDPFSDPPDSLVFGTTTAGGYSTCVSYVGTGCGTVWWESLPSPGFDFVAPFYGGDGAVALGGVTLDPSGNTLYGATARAAPIPPPKKKLSLAQYWGAVYLVNLVNNQSDNQQPLPLYSFCLSGFPCADGETPQSSVVLDSFGNLYGTASNGGTGNGDGVVYVLCNGNQGPACAQ